VDHIPTSSAGLGRVKLWWHRYGMLCAYRGLLVSKYWFKRKSFADRIVGYFVLRGVKLDGKISSESWIETTISHHIDHPFAKLTSAVHVAFSILCSSKEILRKRRLNKRNGTNFIELSVSSKS
jgi:hypothetical protein